jgi:hypothetical protein
MTDLELIKSQLGDIVNRLDELHQAFPDGVSHADTTTLKHQVGHN